MKTRVQFSFVYILCSVFVSFGYAKGITHEQRLFWFNSYPQQENTNFSQEILVANKRSTENGIVVNKLSAQLFYKMNCAFSDVSTGLQQTEDSNSFMVDADYWFMRFYSRLPIDGNGSIRIKYRLGLNVIYNFQLLTEVSCQNNFYIGLNSELAAGRKIVFGASVLYGAKYSKICTSDSAVPGIFNNDLGFKLSCTVSLPHRFVTAVSISSYEDFYYPLFCAPTFTLGVSYSAKNKFIVTGEAAARYIDMFTMSSYLDCFWFRLAVGFTFK